MNKSILKLIALFFILALGGYLLQNFEISQGNLKDFMSNFLVKFGNYSIIIYILLCGLLICFAVPRQFLSFVGGYTFGTLEGAAFATLGVLLGCVLSFYLARFIGRSFVQERYGKRIEKMENFLKDNIFLTTLIIRLLPLGMNLATNIFTGLTKSKASLFFLASFIGYIPQNFIFSMLGSGIQLEAHTQTALSGILFVVALLLGFYLYSNNKKIAKQIQEININ